MKLRKKFLYFTLVFAIFAGFTGSLSAKIEIGKEIEAKILYDYSGSMYPGYPGTPRHRSGVNFFHQYDHFRSWFTNFVSAQTRFNAKTVSLSIFRSPGRFRPEDIKETHPSVPCGAFNVNRAFSQSRPDGVDYTYLAESLDCFTQNNFEGIVWLITDNRVEPGQGEQTTKDFFIGLRDTDKYRSVHIYGLPFDDPARNQHSDLAVYGILVSPDEISNETSQWYDERFFDFEELFTGNQHLKLKDLSINPLQIDIEPIEVDIESYKKGFSEGKLVKIPMKGTIRSKLTQHTIIGGTLKIEPIGDFIPDGKAKQEFGVKEVSGKLFKSVEIPLEEIPPNGMRDLPKFHIESKTKVPLKFSGLGNLIQVAAKGLRVKYTGKGLVSSNRIDVELKKEGRLRIGGIYSSEEIGPVFGAQAEIKEIQAKPAVFEISFILKSSSIYWLLLLLFLLLAIVPLAFLGIFLTRKERYRIRTEQKEEIVELRRLGSYMIRSQSYLLGTLKRGMGSTDRFTPNTTRAGLTVTPGKQPGEFDVSINIKDEKKSFKLSIEPLNKSRSIAHVADSSLSRPTPGPGLGKPTKPISPQGPTPSRTKPKVTIRRPT